MNNHAFLCSHILLGLNLVERIRVAMFHLIVKPLFEGLFDFELPYYRIPLTTLNQYQLQQRHSLPRKLDPFLRQIEKSIIIGRNKTCQVS